MRPYWQRARFSGSIWDVIERAGNGEAVRGILAAMGVDQSAAARALDVSPRTMRRYCSGEAHFPLAVEYALRYLAACKSSHVEPSPPIGG